MTHSWARLHSLDIQYLFPHEYRNDLIEFFGRYETTLDICHACGSSVLGRPEMHSSMFKSEQWPFDTRRGESVCWGGGEGLSYCPHYFLKHLILKNDIQFTTRPPS